MNPVQETVLLYYPKKPKYLPKIKSIFVQLGIQFRILDAASTAQKIGYLTGRTGFEKSTSDVPFSKIPQSVLVMDHFLVCGWCAVFLFEKSRHSFHRPEGDRDRYQCRLDIFRTLSGDCKRTCTDACKKSNRHTYRRVGFWM